MFNTKAAMPKVSIITLTLNRVDYLRKNIQSVLSQGIEDIEIIVMNDNSTDNTCSMVESLNDKRIRLINFSCNGIIARSRNEGLRLSTGEFVAFVDDDDLWAPGKLKKQIAYAEEHPDYDFFYCLADRIDGQGKDLGIYCKGKAFEGNIFKTLLRENCICLPSVLMRRKVVEFIGYFSTDIALSPCDDYDYWLRASLKFKFGCVKESLAFYRVHGANFSNYVNIHRSRQNVLLNIRKNSETPKELYGYINTIVKDVNWRISFCYWTQGKKKEAREFILSYIDFCIKKIYILGAIWGILLLSMEFFSFSMFRGLYRYLRKT